jgi:hypothetical protein
VMNLDIEFRAGQVQAMLAGTGSLAFFFEFSGFFTCP